MRGIVFDLDGTLLDSMPLVLRMFAHAVSPFVEPLGDERWRSLLGGPPRRILEGVLNNPADAEEALLRLAHFQHEQAKHIALFTGVKSLLSDLRSAGVMTGIWTGRDRRSTQTLIAEHGLGEMLTSCICGDDLTSHKPDSEGLQAVLVQMNTSPAEALFVGDSPVDVMAGASLGTKTLWITHGLDRKRPIEGLAWRVVNTPIEAYALIRDEYIR